MFQKPLGRHFSLWLAGAGLLALRLNGVFMLQRGKQSDAYGMLGAAGKPRYYGMDWFGKRGILRRFSIIHFSCP